MKKIYIVLLTLLPALNSYAGDTLSLARCWELGQAAFPLTGNKALLDESLQLKLKSLTTNYYPQLSVIAQASYQSEVTSIDLSNIPFPIDIATPAKDQYKLALDVQQTIYDAGGTKHSKAVERLGNKEAQYSNQADWHSMKQQIQQIYFAGLLYQSQKKVINLLLETLKENIAVAESAVRNGFLAQRDLNLLKVEQLNAEQQQTEAQHNVEACLKMLEQLTQSTFATTTTLEMPAAANPESDVLNNQRAELFALDARRERLLATKELLNAEITPRIGLFGQAGYGRPGLNMLSTDFDPYYIVGVRLSWTPWNWGSTQKNKKIQDTQAKIVANQQAAFDERVRTQAWSARYEIYKQEKLVTQDLEIVALREKITRESASQLRNGAITTSDYIKDLNAEMTARINAEIHTIRFVKSQLEYRLTLGLE